MVNVLNDLNSAPELRILVPKLNGFREKMNHVFATCVDQAYLFCVKTINSTLFELPSGKVCKVNDRHCVKNV
jgi:hypothetical protein